MFAAFLALPLLVSASPLDHFRRQNVSQCNTGGVTCCESVYNSTSEYATSVMSTIGVAVQGVDVLMGENCSPVSIVGIGSGVSCNSSPMCCTSEYPSEGNLVSLGCVPVEVDI